jgi:selenocysteine lyase/cysteine desulfurase
MTNAFEELERGVFAALETYSNVHRGTGHNSMVSTHLYEQARDIVLEYLGLDKGKYVVIFCSPARAAILMAQLKPESYKSISSQDIGLSLGVKALAVKRKALPKGAPLQTGGGTTRLVSPEWVVWAKSPDRFEAGTPAIINVIAFARALKLIRQSGNKTINQSSDEKLTTAQILYHDELEEYSGWELLDKLRQTLIGRNVLVPTSEGTRRFINLDNGASTPTFTPVWNAVCRTWRQSAQIQQEIIHEVKSICADFLGAPLAAYDIIFTSNTTEAINLAAESLGRESAGDTEPVVINTILEHNSNDLPWRMLPGLALIRLQADAEGFLDLKELDALLCEYNQEEAHGKKRIRLVAVSGASNVLGTFNNLEEISRIVHRYGARLLVDAAQMVAHRKVEIEKTGIDYLAFSAHKVYAPFGTGVLVVRKGLLNFSPAELDLIQSSGEENAGGIAALGKALVLLQRIGLDLVREEEQTLTGRALRGLAQIANLSVYGIKDPDSRGFAQKGGVIVFAMKDKFSNVVAKELAEQGGIGIRNGCHCSHMLVKRLLKVSPGLERFQHLIAILFHKVNFPGVARISMGIGNSEEDIDILIQVLGKIAQKNGTPKKTDVKKQMNEFIKAAAERVY